MQARVEVKVAKYVLSGMIPAERFVPLPTSSHGAIHQNVKVLLGRFAEILGRPLDDLLTDFCGHAAHGLGDLLSRASRAYR